MRSLYTERNGRQHTQGLPLLQPVSACKAAVSAAVQAHARKGCGQHGDQQSGLRLRVGFDVKSFVALSREYGDRITSLKVT